MPKTNVLFIFTDEQRTDTMACYGNDRINTPNLNRLAEQSVIFRNSYVTQPVCTPSRSSIMTGLYPHTNGCVANNIPLRSDTPAIAELWQDGNYRFAYHGKWHLGDEIFRQHGFDEWISIEDMYRRYYSEGRDRRETSDYHRFLVEQGYEPSRTEEGWEYFGRRFASDLPPEHTKPIFLACEACRFIEENRANPFVLFVNFLEPHMPFNGPYNERYPVEDVPLPLNHEVIPNDEPLHCRLLRKRLFAGGYGGHILTEPAGWKRLTGNYWGLVELVDEAVGRILAALSDYGLDENTLIVFTSDHGDMMGSHRLLTKCVMYEEAVKVPLLMRVPGVEPAEVERPVSQVDLVPTLLDLCGQGIAPQLEGHSLKSVLERSGPPEEDYVFIEWNGPDRTGILRETPQEFSNDEIEKVSTRKGRTVISPDGWKLNLNEDDRHELYNLVDDPFESANVFYSGEYGEVISRLLDRLEMWQERTCDNCSLNIESP